MIKHYYGTYNISHLKDSGFNCGFALYQAERGKAAVGAFFDYSMKDQLKSLGLKWDNHARCWFTPVKTAQEAGKKMIELAEKLGIQAFSVALDNYFEKYDKNFEKWCQPKQEKEITIQDIQTYRGFPFVNNFEQKDTRAVRKLIAEIEEKTGLPFTFLEWEGQIFSSKSEIDLFIDGSNDCEYDYD